MMKVLQLVLLGSVSISNARPTEREFDGSFQFDFPRLERRQNGTASHCAIGTLFNTTDSLCDNLIPGEPGYCWPGYSYAVGGACTQDPITGVDILGTGCATGCNTADQFGNNFTGYLISGDGHTCVCELPFYYDNQGNCSPCADGFVPLVDNFGYASSCISPPPDYVPVPIIPDCFDILAANTQAAADASAALSAGGSANTTATTDPNSSTTTGSLGGNGTLSIGSGASNSTIVTPDIGNGSNSTAPNNSTLPTVSGAGGTTSPGGLAAGSVNGSAVSTGLGNGSGSGNANGNGLNGGIPLGTTINTNNGSNGTINNNIINNSGSTTTTNNNTTNYYGAAPASPIQSGLINVGVQPSPAGSSSTGPSAGGSSTNAGMSGGGSSYGSGMASSSSSNGRENSAPAPVEQQQQRPAAAVSPAQPIVQPQPQPPGYQLQPERVTVTVQQQQNLAQQTVLVAPQTTMTLNAPFQVINMVSTVTIALATTTSTMFVLRDSIQGLATPTSVPTSSIAGDSSGKVVTVTLAVVKSRASRIQASTVLAVVGLVSSLCTLVL